MAFFLSGIGFGHIGHQNHLITVAVVQLRRQGNPATGTQNHLRAIAADGRRAFADHA